MQVDQTGSTAGAEAVLAVGRKASIPESLLRYVRSNTLGAIGGGVLLVAILTAILAPLLAPNDPQQIALAEKFSPPFSVGGLILNQSQGGMCICRVLGIGAGVSRECFGP